jgi:hypothetical protein
MLSIYGVYQDIMRKIGIIPRDYEISWISSSDIDIGLRDLLYECNNGNRPVPNLLHWNLPIIKQNRTSQSENYQIDLRSWKRLNLTTIEKIMDANRSYTVDIYENASCGNDKKDFIYHDSNISIPHNNQLIRKEWFSEHFRFCYFFWSPFDNQTFKKFDVSLVIDISMERFLNDYRLYIFDEDYYLNHYRDVLIDIENGKIESAHKHYELYGIHEGRYPNKFREVECCCYKNKSQRFYIPNNEDRYSQKYRIVDLFINEFPMITPFQFYQLYGYKMGHQYAEKLARDLNLSIFDENYYINKYQDIKNAIKSGLLIVRLIIIKHVEFTKEDYLIKNSKWFVCMMRN